MANALLQQAGEEFNSVTSLLEGGVNQQNKAAILTDLETAQTQLAAVIKVGEGNGTYSGLSAIHLQSVHDELSLEIQTVEKVGSVSWAPRELNDLQLDIVDIVQGDATIAGQAGDGFGMYPHKLEPTPHFADNAAQTAFWAQYVTDSNNLGSEAVALVSAHPGQPAGAAGAALISQIQAYEAHASAFDLAQGGIFSARFDNELTTNGVVGTDSRALIDGIEHGNLVEVKAAATAMAANAADVNGNNDPVGTTPAPVVSGIPATFTSFGQVGTVFDDATTKLIGGIFTTGGTTNATGIVTDLTAVNTGLHQVTAANPGMFNAQALADITKMEGLINSDIAAVKAVGTDPLASQHIHDDQLGILTIVQNDPTLKALAANHGFTPLPEGAPGSAHDAGVPVAQDAHHPQMQVASNDWMFTHH